MMSGAARSIVDEAAKALPWLRVDGPSVTKRPIFTRLDGAGALRRTDFNDRAWKPALVTAAE